MASLVLQFPPCWASPNLFICDVGLIEKRSTLGFRYHLVLIRVVNQMRLCRNWSSTLGVATDFVWLTLATGSSMTFTFLFWVLVSGRVSPEVLGMTAGYLALSIYVSSIGSLGLQAGIVRFLHRFENRSRTMNSFLLTSLFASATFGLLLSLTIGLLGSGEDVGLTDVRQIGLFLLVTSSGSLNLLIDSALLSGGKSSLVAVRNALAGATRLLLLFPVGSSVEGIVSAWLIGSAVSLCIGYRIVGRTREGNAANLVPYHDSNVRDVLRFSVIGAIGSFFWGIPQGFFPYFASSFIGPEKGAFFYIAFTVAQIPVSLIQIMSVSSLKYVSGREIAPKGFFLRILAAEQCTSLVSLLVVLLFGTNILRIFGGIYSQESFVPLLLLVGASFFLSVISVSATVLLIRESIWKVNMVYIPASFAVIVGGLLLMDDFGPAGISLGFVIGYGLGSVISAYLVIKK